MKKLIIALFIFLSSIGNSIANEYSLLEPPKEVKYEIEQARYFYNVSAGCTYLYILQNKHATFSQLLDGGQSSAEWSGTTADASNYWVQKAITIENLLVKDFGLTSQQISQYKQGQIDYLNTFFMTAFMETDIREYFMKILNSTGYCVAGVESIETFIRLANENQKSAPQFDKPTKKM